MPYANYLAVGHIPICTVNKSCQRESGEKKCTCSRVNIPYVYLNIWNTLCYFKTVDNNIVDQPQLYSILQYLHPVQGNFCEDLGCSSLVSTWYPLGATKRPGVGSRWYIASLARTCTAPPPIGTKRSKLCNSKLKEKIPSTNYVCIQYDVLTMN